MASWLGRFKSAIFLTREVLRLGLLKSRKTGIFCYFLIYFVFLLLNNFAFKTNNPWNLQFLKDHFGEVGVIAQVAASYSFLLITIDECYQDVRHNGG